MTIDDLESKMRKAIVDYSNERSSQSGHGLVMPKYIYLGSAQRYAFEAMTHVHQSRSSEDQRREYMGVEVIYVGGKDTFLTVGE